MPDRKTGTAALRAPDKLCGEARGDCKEELSKGRVEVRMLGKSRGRVREG